MQLLYCYNQAPALVYYQVESLIEAAWMIEQQKKKMMQSVNSNPCFNESQWMKLVFLLADTQCWLEEMSKDLFAAVPVSNQRKYFKKTYFLTPAALAHILERHYYKINRHPEAGKFHVSLPCLLELIRDASAMEVFPMKGCLNYYRVLRTDCMIGFDKDGKEERRMTVITDAGGGIVTAFPGVLEEKGKPIADSRYS